MVIVLSNLDTLTRYRLAFDGDAADFYRVLDVTVGPDSGSVLLRRDAPGARPFVVSEDEFVHAFGAAE
jgi:hypothetical protein